MGEVPSEAQWGTEMSCNLGLSSIPVDAGRSATTPGWRRAQNRDGADGAGEGGLSLLGRV